jgi:hypothetical protein
MLCTVTVAGVPASAGAGEQRAGEYSMGRVSLLELADFAICHPFRRFRFLGQRHFPELGIEGGGVSHRV